MSKVFISATDEYLFAQGTHYDIYKKLGAHPSTERGQKGFFFSVWAPNAMKVYVIGAWSDWDETAHQMKKLGPGGIFTLFIPGVRTDELYKYLIITGSGEKLYKADPFANYAEMRPGTASKTTDITSFKWTDQSWIRSRDTQNHHSAPLAIYECHIGSWMRHPHGNNDGFYSYREFAARIVAYLKEMRYTHVELIGISEHPYDGSWGYQVTGYYAPTSRYGSPTDFMYLVNLLHRNHIGVILDWVPAHFCTDSHGLASFDGECIYEHPDPRIGEHPDWGTKIFNYGKNEVKNFLIANVLYWIREYHIDGIRVDAVASMLYLDYGKNDGQWVANSYGGNKNYDAIEFFRHMNSVIHGAYPGFMSIAEESTDWPAVTGSVQQDGLGFNYKWNMGWMHDFCQYMKLDPYFRRDNHYALTFAMSYNHAEKYILPLSHDEVVHLKCSMVGKMPGYKVDKYANLRAGYTFMFGHCGKKLLFMGQDFGQEREWDEDRELDWYLLGEKLNRGLHEYVKELLRIYRKYPCMYEIDDSWAGFEWLNADDCGRSTYTFFRKAKKAHGKLMFIINMTPMTWNDYLIGVPKKGKFTLLLDSGNPRFGGETNTPLPAELISHVEECNGYKWSVSLDLPPYCAAIYLF
ncbi:MAG: 1,4-alpha-glucan branching protein GlgB [Lachnospiraceae bacterium]|jgi:1,4-alpha-glucan branching enzyme|nr:1,4-alpha-glucan branching protein GlgB [Lachnospiraceae bacterium]